MLYLLYLRKGFIKKFPLDKKTIFLGRSTDNDFYLSESFISHKHAKINVFKDHIVIEDMNSTNGIFIQSTKIRKATVKPNQWFRIGYINFFLKKGNPQELVGPILLLLSDAGSFLHGVSLCVDGGFSIYSGVGPLDEKKKD